MNEDIWMEEVEEILSEKGVELNIDNDGWMFMFECGYLPSVAVNEMLRKDL